MLSKQAFGRTEQASTRLIFGAYALSKATQAEADRLSDHRRGHAALAPDAGCGQSLRCAASRGRDGRARRRLGHPADFRLSMRFADRRYRRGDGAR